MERAGAEIIAFPRRGREPASPPAEIGDLRFRALAGEEAWASLPEAVRERFGRHIGAVLAQLCRLIGAPLPLSRDAFVPAVVSVTEDPASGGQFWTRLYGRRRGPSSSLRTCFPQAIRSIKRFCGPTGLEEYVGRGIGIALSVEIAQGALHFLSDHYFLSVPGLRLRLPRWLSPGRMRVSHIDCGHGSFAFVLRLDHPRLGELICQTAMFEERRAPDDRRATDRLP
jgi:hypothetical protein